MPLYEHVLMARHDISAQQMDALMEKFAAILKEKGGKIVGKEYWGLKNLAYRIKKNRKAHYGFFQFDTPHEALAEMERQMALSNDVLRFLTIKVEEHEKLPSAMMRKSEERGRRGGRFGSPRGERKDQSGARQ